MASSEKVGNVCCAQTMGGSHGESERRVMAFDNEGDAQSRERTWQYTPASIAVKDLH
jgi:hypothetical protein